MWTDGEIDVLLWTCVGMEIDVLLWTCVDRQGEIGVLLCTERELNVLRWTVTERGYCGHNYANREIDIRLHCIV